MNFLKFILFVVLMFLISCSKENNQSEYPKTFVFHHSTITGEQGFVFGDAESYVVINSKAGHLDSLRFYVTNDLYHYIRDQMFGYYVESFTITSKDTVQIKAWENGQTIIYSLPAFVNNPNGGILNRNDFGTVLLYDKTKGELKFCIAVALGIFNLNANFYYDLDYEFCLAVDPQQELQNFISNNSYQKNDTLGIYMLEMVYKE